MSADNNVPERHIVIDTLRNAAPLLGLRASVLATLDAMLSCLPPKRSHHIVFASNATLSFRRNGITDRTLRRHAALLQEAGLLIRRDSPNGKRFSKQNSREGKVLRFGFDLSPLFDRLAEIAAMAAEVLQQNEEIAYLRCKIRTAMKQLLDQDPEHPQALAARRLLRRKLTVTECHDALNALAVTIAETEGDIDTPTCEQEDMSASNGQNVRHHHKSKKENIDKKNAQSKDTAQSTQDQPPVTVSELVATCSEAAMFSLAPVETVPQVIAHARTIAPMIGIDRSSYQAAEQRLGLYSTAITVWAMMQFHDRIQSVGAYFRSITTGRKSADFDPMRLVRRLTQSQASPA